jgi:hypothetical protein
VLKFQFKTRVGLRKIFLVSVVWKSGNITQKSYKCLKFEECCINETKFNQLPSNSEVKINRILLPFSRHPQVLFRAYSVSQGEPNTWLASACFIFNSLPIDTEESLSPYFSDVIGMAGLPPKRLPGCPAVSQAHDCAVKDELLMGVLCIVGNLRPAAYKVLTHLEEVTVCSSAFPLPYSIDYFCDGWNSNSHLGT